MEYRQLGGSGLRVPALSLGTATFGGEGEFFRGLGRQRGGRGDAARRHLPRRGRHDVRLLERLLRGRGREHPRAGDQGPPRQGADLDQGHVPVRRRAERRRVVAAPSGRRRRGQPPTPRHRLHRPVSDARVRRRHPGRGNARHPERPGPGRQDPLRRLLELLGLAPDEIAGGVGPSRLAAVRGAPGVTTRSSDGITNGS